MEQSEDAGRSRRRPRSVALSVAIGVAVTGAVMLTACSARDTAVPAPTLTSSSSSSSPSPSPSASSARAPAPTDDFGDGSAPGRSPGADAWFRTALPVEASIVGMVPASSEDGSVGPAAGTVRITRDGEGAIQIRFEGLQVSTQADSDLRVQLAASDVVVGTDGIGTVVRNGTADGIVGGDPIEVGLLPLDASTTVLTFATPQILPTSVHSVLILDYRHATVLAGAELVPVGG